MHYFFVKQICKLYDSMFINNLIAIIIKYSVITYNSIGRLLNIYFC